MSGNVRVAVVLTLAILWLLFWTPFQLLALLAARIGWLWPAGAIPVIFHRGVLFLFGVRLHREGRRPKTRPLLIVSNHVSWLDIVVLSSIGPLSFVAKAEMAGWPVLGQLAKMQRTIFVKREARRSSGAQAEEIAQRMADHEVMVLFPEATTTDGNAVLDFKTSLFEAAKLALAATKVESAAVQPCAIDYVSLHGLPLGRADRPHVAWPGEVGIGESLLPLVRAGALDVYVRLGEPITLTRETRRKEVASLARTRIREMLYARHRTVETDGPATGEQFPAA